MSTRGKPKRGKVDKMWARTLNVWPKVKPKRGTWLREYRTRKKPPGKD